MANWDVIVVGAGNAGLCAAHAARERGRARAGAREGRREAGGRQHLLHRRRDPHRPRRARGPARTSSTADERLAGHRPRPVQRRGLRRRHAPRHARPLRPATGARCWSATRPTPCAGCAARASASGCMYERQAYEVDGRYRVLGRARARHRRRRQGADRAAPRRGASATGIEVRYDAAVEASCATRTAPSRRGGPVRRRARAELEARRGRARRRRLRGQPAAARARTSAPNWDVAKVRGTPHNTGEVLRAALAAGAQAYGALERLPRGPVGRGRAADRRPRADQPLLTPVLSAGDRGQRATAERFIDEGADFRNYTYAKYGAEMLRQPGAIAFQIFDATTAPLLRTIEYEAPRRHRVRGRHARRARRAGSASTPPRLERTVARVQRGDPARRPFDPTVKDGKRTAGLDAAEVATGRCRSTRRRSSPSPSPAASRSPSAA